MIVPYRFRRLHRWYAGLAGYFWLPCPLCGREFGGHEWRDVSGLASSVPDPRQPPTGSDGPFCSVGICPLCTRAGRGIREWRWDTDDT